MKKSFLILFFIPVLIFAQFPQFNLNKIEKNAFKLISGNSNSVLAAEVSNHLGVPLCKAKINRFNDGEINLQIEESIRGFDVYIIQSTSSTQSSSVNDNLMELFLLIRACKRASAKSITAIIPYYGYARQDRKIESRVPISASDVALLLETAGVDHVIALDLHCGQIQGFFHNTPVDNLLTSVVFVPYFVKKDLFDLTVVAPDSGALSRAKNFVAGLKEYGINAKLAVIVKQRSKPGEVEEMTLVGSVQDSDVLIVDDMCDTGGTLVKAAKRLKDKGARKIYACITHPVFSGSALERIRDSVFDELIVTDTIPLKANPPNNIKQISIAPLLAEAIRRSDNRESLSYLFKY